MEAEIMQITELIPPKDAKIKAESIKLALLSEKCN